ncbi:MAG: putative transcriptional regulator [Frondihabitans sp.]|nr:putative transcriptional regulator [Frondihabitans sp.]
MAVRSTDTDTRLPAMADVARVAGVSPQTVSRALSGHPNVQAKTKAKVLAAVEELGYRRNNAARALKSGRSRIIGVVILETSFFSRTAVTFGIEGSARKAGYSVRTATTDSLESDSVERAVLQLADEGVEGIVLAIPLIEASDIIRAVTRSIPTIAIDGSRTPSTEVIAVDQERAARLATEHLLSLGHNTVWHVSGPSMWSDAAGRSRGWQAALDDADIEAPPELHGDWSPESGYRNGQILGRIPEATAVFVSSDEMAFGVIRALHELGRRIPEDVSVVGVDNIALAEYCSPSLTTVAQPFTEIGALAVEHLVRLIADPQAVPEPITIEPQLIIRASTAPPTPTAS